MITAKKSDIYQIRSHRKKCDAERYDVRGGNIELMWLCNTAITTTPLAAK